MELCPDKYTKLDLVKRIFCLRVPFFPRNGILRRSMERVYAIAGNMIQTASVARVKESSSQYRE